MSNDSKKENKGPEDLISKLSGDLEPCEPLKHPLKRMAPWVIIASLYVALVAFFGIGVRPDIWDMLIHNHRFQLDIGLATMIYLSSGFVLGWVNLPDMRQQPWVVAIPVVFLVLFIGNILFRLFTENLANPNYDMICFPHSVYLTVIPLGYLIFLIRKGCPACHKKSALFATIAISAIGWIGLRFTSPIDHMVHIFFVQFLPFIALGILLGILSAKLFRW
ncbi:MAG: hypothetical protein CMH32_03890 [Micavibrio sp.]|nr:hypothetical protein [Micavibrio sp.]|tara:strand:+ start:322 stop:981 length:660 start_codon:yes stop_codon:yes gene_type:complete